MKKLVRDKIPEMIVAKGETSITHTASDAEYRAALIEKLQEEVSEFAQTPNHEELADIMEVIEALTSLPEFDRSEVERVKAEKKESRGGFTKRIILTKD